MQMYRLSMRLQNKLIIFSLGKLLVLVSNLF